MSGTPRSALRNLIEYIPARLLLAALGVLPRRMAVLSGRLIARAIYLMHSRLRRVGHRNLSMAMPEIGRREREAIIKGVFRNLGRLIGEFSQFHRINLNNIDRVVVYDGLENYLEARARNRGVLLLTGHFGAWELCAFAHAVYGHPLSFLERPLDNPLLDAMIKKYRQMSGNRAIDKNRAVRSVLESLRQGRDVALLIDTNTLPSQGVFCDFFGIPACSTTGLATFALRSEAPVVPGFLIWDEREKIHCLRFEPEIPLTRTGDFREEVRLNTARFTEAIERQVRRHPDQWLWIHKRWHARPEGHPDLYGADALPSRSPVRLETDES